MKSVFVDNLYWVAILKRKDQWAGPAKQARDALGQVLLVTTDEVLTELLATLSGAGPRLRRAAVELVRRILDNPNIRVLPQTREGFLGGIRLYERREDKEYSLIDCISMNVMESQSLTDILTNDHHFEQEGFTVLIKKKQEPDC